MGAVKAVSLFEAVVRNEEVSEETSKHHEQHIRNIKFVTTWPPIFYMSSQQKSPDTDGSVVVNEEGKGNEKYCIVKMSLSVVVWYDETC